MRQYRFEQYDPAEKTLSLEGVLYVQDENDEKPVAFAGVTLADRGVILQADLRDLQALQYTLERMERMLDLQNFQLDQGDAKVKRLKLENEQLLDIANATRSRLLQAFRLEIKSILSEPSLHGTWVEEDLKGLLDRIR